MSIAGTNGVSSSPTPRWRTRHRLLLGRFVAVALGLTLPFALFELSLRLFGPWAPGGYDTGAYIERHELLGHFHIPGHQGWLRSTEFTTFVEISPLGLRDRRTTYDKPPGAFRILMLGDSFLEGVQVHQWETVAERLEALLYEPGGTPVDVINAGVAAYGTAQEVLLFENEAYRYQPDLVILLFYVGNDVKNNDHAIEIPRGDKDLALKPYFDLDRDGDLVLMPGPPPLQPNPFIGLLRHCCWSYNVLEGNVFATIGPAFRREDLEVVGGARNPIREIYDTNPDRPWRHAWAITEALLARLDAAVRARGASLILVGVPALQSLDDEVWRRTILQRRPADYPAAPSAPTDRLGQIASRLRIPYLDLQPVLQRSTERGSGPFYYATDGHWNATGHAAAAEALAHALDPLNPGALR